MSDHFDIKYSSNDFCFNSMHGLVVNEEITWLQTRQTEKPSIFI